MGRSAPTISLPLSIDARYLFGAPAGDLPIEGEVLLRTTTTLDAYPGYRFGRYDADIQPEVCYLPGDLRTDARTARRRSTSNSPS